MRPQFVQNRGNQKEFGMAARSYDIITVGGGIAASSLAMAMAGRGAKVLVLEREKQF
jgi:menaquinone-9 beta-reductase